MQLLSAITLILILAILFLSFVTIQQGTIGVVTIFGKYRRILGPGLNMKIPLVEVIN